MLTPDLSLDNHVTSVSDKCFFQLRQLRCIRRSLDDDSAATLVRAFVASAVDFCDSLLIGSPKKTTDKLQRVLRAVARIASNTRKYDRGLNQFQRSKFRCLDIGDRVRFWVCFPLFKFLLNMAPGYLSSLCQQIMVNWSPPYQFGQVHGSSVRLRRSYNLELTKLTILKTSIVLYQLSNATPSSSLRTSTLSAFDVFYKNAIYKLLYMDGSPILYNGLPIPLKIAYSYGRI